MGAQEEAGFKFRVVAVQEQAQAAVGSADVQPFLFFHAVVSGGQDRAAQSGQHDLKGLGGLEAVLDVHEPQARPHGFDQLGHDVFLQGSGQGRAQGDALGREESRGQGTGAELLEFFEVESGTEVFRCKIVEGRAVDVRDLGEVGGRLHAALDLEAVHPRLPEPAQVLDQAQVLGAHDLGVLLVLADFPHVLARTQPFFEPHRRDLVVEAAGMGAQAKVPGPLVQVRREQAASGDGHAHGPMDEHFKLQPAHLLGHGPDARGPELPRHVDAAHAQIPPEHGRGRIGGVGLGGEMDGDVRNPLPGHGHDAGVGDDDAVHRA